MATGGQNAVDVVIDLFVHALQQVTLDQFAIPDNRGQRRAQFVAHHTQKRGAHLLGSLGFGTGGGKRGQCF